MSARLDWWWVAIAMLFTILLVLTFTDADAQEEPAICNVTSRPYVSPSTDARLLLACESNTVRNTNVLVLSPGGVRELYNIALFLMRNEAIPRHEWKFWWANTEDLADVEAAWPPAP